MKSIVIIFIVAFGITACDFSLSDKKYFVTEVSRIYSPDSSKFISQYFITSGAFDGSNTINTSILSKEDTLKPETFGFLSLEFDTIYWKGNDTIFVSPKSSEFKNYKTDFKDTVIKGVIDKIK